jgi:hypothetical protein
MHQKILKYFIYGVHRQNNNKSYWLVQTINGYPLVLTTVNGPFVADSMVKLLTKLLTKLANMWPNSLDLSLVVCLFHSVKSCSVWSCVFFHLVKSCSVWSHVLFHLVKSCSVWLCVFFSLVELMFSLIMCFIHWVKSSL